MEFQYSIHPPLLDSPTSNSITYEYSTSEFPTDYASTTDADAAKRYGTERRRKIKLKDFNSFYC